MRPFSAAAVQAHLTSNIGGKQVPFADEQLHEITDWKRVRKIYKLPTGLNLGAEPKGEVVVNRDVEGDGDEREAEMIILSAIALRGAS
jgi:hypothetical protein